MRIQLSGLLQDMHGSMGNTVAGKWKGLHYFREKASYIANPQTPAQIKMRNNLVMLLGMYKDLPLVNKALWEEYAQAQGRANYDESQEGSRGLIPLRSRIQSGINAYVGVNQVLKSADLPNVPIPPIGSITAPTAFDISYDPATHLLSVEFLGVGETGEGDTARIWLKGQWSGSHPYIAKLETTTTTLDTIRMGSMRYVEEVRFEDIEVPSRWVKVQMDAVTQTGIRSPATQVKEVKIHLIPPP